MKFVDEATITVQSGNGGPGCTSFRRERFIEKGGPDGGDGGDGGNVILRVDPSKRTLIDYRRNKLFKARNGSPGEGKQKHGRNGTDIILDLPAGTIVSHAESNEVIIDLTQVNETFTIAHGGKGGRGNKRFATSTNRAPRYSQPGLPGTELKLKLELKLLADVGIIGLPNAGKSTLISRISAARPKVADYPFTTLTPTLGMVDPGFGQPFAVADIPGLIEGAHEGIGLGITFLKHVERTKLLVHLVDASQIDLSSPLKAFDLINRELARYSETLAGKEQVVVLNKTDLTGTEQQVDSFKNALGSSRVLAISAATGNGCDRLVQFLARCLDPENQK